MIRRVLCLCFTLQTWSGHPGVLGTEEDGFNLQNDSFNNLDAWKLVKADNNAIATLSELSDGVFSLQLSAGRSDCATGTGFVLATFPTIDDYHIIAYICICFLLQTTWGLTTGPARQHCLPNPLLGQSCEVPARL